MGVANIIIPYYYAHQVSYPLVLYDTPVCNFRLMASLNVRLLIVDADFRLLGLKSGVMLHDALCSETG